MVNFSKFKSSPQGVLNWFKGHDQNKWKTTFEEESNYRIRL